MLLFDPWEDGGTGHGRLAGGLGERVARDRLLSGRQGGVTFSSISSSSCSSGLAVIGSPPRRP